MVRMAFEVIMAHAKLPEGYEFYDFGVGSTVAPVPSDGYVDGRQCLSMIVCAVARIGEQKYQRIDISRISKKNDDGGYVVELLPFLVEIDRAIEQLG